MYFYIKTKENKKYEKNIGRFEESNSKKILLWRNGICE